MEIATSPEAPKQYSTVLSNVNVLYATINACVVTYPWKELAPLSFELTTIKLQSTSTLGLRDGKDMVTSKRE